MRHALRRSGSTDATTEGTSIAQYSVGQRLDFAHQGGYRSTDGEIEPFDEGGLNEAGGANGFEFTGQGIALTAENAGDGVGQLAVKNQ